MRARIKALDLFAGTGWGVACKRLGIKEAGVEIMPEAVETRTANGMETIYRDVWDGAQLTAEQHREQYGPYGLLIASPPCQTFSLAGKGAGRAALDEVLEAIELHAYKDANALLAFGEKHDMRTALVLTPLAYVWRDRPRLVALEQVPTVLPVWEACAEVMREWGYEVKVEVLNAEQYGVPQTRKRAILVARRGGPVELPTPTHSRYYSRTPNKLDPGVKKWVSMAEALGWGAKDQPSHTITAGVHGPKDRFASGGSGIRKALDAKIGGPDWIDKPDQTTDSRTTYGQRFDVEDVAALQTYPTMLRSNYGTGGDASNRGERTSDQPAPTLTSKADRSKWDGERNMSVQEAAALQSYPVAASKNMGRGMVERYGERPGRDIQEPAFTLRANAGGTEPGGFIWDNGDGTTRKLATDEAAALQSYPSWVDNRPAPTIVGTRRSAGGMLVGRQLDDDSRRDIGGHQTAKGLRAGMLPGVRVSGEQAATLQTYEPPFIWRGTKTKQFLQIGNAVPPLLAEHILAALVGIPVRTAA